jgi:hypothetical protein
LLQQPLFGPEMVRGVLRHILQHVPNLFGIGGYVLISDQRIDDADQFFVLIVQ